MNCWDHILKVFHMLWYIPPHSNEVRYKTNVEPNKKCRQRLLCIPIKVISEYTAQQNTPIRIAYFTNELMQDIFNIYFVYWFKLVHYFERCFNTTFRTVWFVCYCKILWALTIFVKESSKKFAKLMRWLNKIQIRLVVWMMWNKFWWVFFCVCVCIENEL